VVVVDEVDRMFEAIRKYATLRDKVPTLPSAQEGYTVILSPRLYTATLLAIRKCATLRDKVASARECGTASQAPQMFWVSVLAAAGRPLAPLCDEVPGGCAMPDEVRSEFTATLERVYSEFTATLQRVYSEFTASLQRVYSKFRGAWRLRDARRGWAWCRQNASLRKSL
jgi:hypothetical protein